MSRLRTLCTTLVLALALATAIPAAAAPRDPGPALAELVPHWILSLFEKIGLPVDPNGSGNPVTQGDGGDIGWGIDPNG